MQKKMTPLKILQNQSRIAGITYLIIALVGGFSIGYMPGELIDLSNATQSIYNITTHITLFKTGMVGDLIVILLELVLTVLLYLLFHSFSLFKMKVATYARFAMAVIMALNLINYLIPLLLINEATLFVGFTGTQLESLILLFLKAHRYTELIWQFFFAVHLLFLGTVLCKTKLTSPFLAGFMVLGSLGYAGDSIVRLLQLNSTILSMSFSILLVFAVIGELWFAIWLIARAGKRLHAYAESN